MEQLLNWLKTQRLIVIASQDGGELWITNVYFGVDDEFKLYFISPESTKHSQQILNNPNIAFSVTWYDPANHKNRKAVQGQGVCRIATNDAEIAMGVQLHNQNFPEFTSRITVDWVNTNEYKSHVWVIEPSYIKHWNDEVYGDDESEEFNMSLK
jgi:uncharacterized protein YhbP (UPF0306 family)